MANRTERKEEKKMRQLWTAWGRKTDPEHVLSDYPRPQMMRPQWRNLNGYWDYAITPRGERPARPDGRILVPFSPESVLSGVGRQLGPDEVLWYRTAFSLSERELAGRRILLHIGAADQFAAVYVNGKKAGSHTGGYLPFSIDITAQCRAENTLVIAVRDVSDTSYFARGKQKLCRGGMYYTAVSGLWQTVWLESVPADYIGSVETHPFADGQTKGVTFAVRPGASPVKHPVSVRIFRPALYTDSEFAPEDAVLLTEAEGLSEEAFFIPLPEIRSWSADAPYLYYYTVTMGEDAVTGYFGLRDIAVRTDDGGRARVYLNGKELYIRGVLDQGYWPDGIYTAPADEAFVFDITEMKKTGFNLARKHAKIEAERWYYHCDRLGLYVMQDMVNGGSPYKDWFVTYLATFSSWLGIPVSDRPRRLLARENARGRQHFEEEMKATVRALSSHPSVLSWVLFNEGWGQFEAARLTEELKKLDPDRLVDSTSGWFDQGCGDFRSTHFYFLTYRFRPERSRASILSEVGGYAMHVPGHSAFDKVYGYRVDTDTDALRKRYEKLLSYMDGLREAGFCGYVYTQWSDIEEEVNGVYTYDRAVRKIR